MVTDAREPVRNYPVPAVGNTIAEDFARLILALTAIGIDVGVLLDEIATKAAALHEHQFADVVGLVTALNNKAAADHKHALGGLSDVDTAGAAVYQVLAKALDGKWRPWTIDLANAIGGAAYAKLNGAIFTGSVKVPTVSTSADSTDVANVTMLRAAMAALVASAPSSLDTLNELAAALGNDANFATTVINALAGKVGTADLKPDGTPNAPVLYGANGELLGKKLIISGPADQQRLEFWADGVAQWIAYRDADGKFNIWGHGQGTALVIDPSNNRVNFTALPKVYGNRDVCILDADGKLPALDGSKLTNVAGAVLQTKSAVYSSTASINTAIPMDATAPQNTEGTQILSVVITPKSASSKLRARFTCPCVALYGSAGRAIAAMFFNAGADAVAASSFYGVNTGNGVLAMDKEFPSGSLSPQTISVRVGPAQAPAVVVNSVDGSTSTLGGVIATMLTVDEVMQ